jgi:hypothetical protein
LPLRMFQVPQIAFPPESGTNQPLQEFHDKSLPENETASTHNGTCRGPVKWSGFHVSLCTTDSCKKFREQGVLCVDGGRGNYFLKEGPTQC